MVPQEGPLWLEDPSVTPFARYYKLKDPERTDFRLNTSSDEDLKLYIDLDNLLPLLQRELGTAAPQFVIHGDFGAGKSHVLRYTERLLAPVRFKAVYLVLSGFHRRSDFFQVHRQFASSLLPLAREALQAPGDKVARVARLEGITDNMRQALENLAIPGMGVPRPAAVDAEQWLSCSRGLTAARMAKAGYSRLLQEEAGPDQLVALYKAISEVYYDAFKRRILLILDEAESFTRVVDVDAQAHIGAGMRALFDTENRSLGFFMGLNTPRARLGVHPMLRSDVQSRVSARQVELRPLSSPDRVARFVSELWPKLTHDPGLFPFHLDSSGLGLVERRIDELNRQLSPFDVQASPGPRDLLNILSHICQTAVEQKIAPPINAEMIAAWFGLGRR